ncbi:MAG: ribonuclease III [Muribaculaceae bacterium]|nr:ribonuclease III [Muribaculaceae bacterium]
MLYKTIGLFPNDINVYKEALTHRSNTQKTNDGKHLNNERLEFLGDAILDAVVADIIFKHFNNKREGFLTNTRAKIVQREHLNKVGLDLGLDKMVISAAHTQSHNSYLYGNALEALIGAIYLDKGYNSVMKFVETKVIDKELKEFAEEELNYKSRLIEWTQKYKTSIEFELVDTSFDKYNSPIFNSAVIIAGTYIAEGSGYTKKESHQTAAKAAYIRINEDKEFCDRLLTEDQ